MNEKLKKLIKLHEGYRQFAYQDTVGKLTVGIGRNLEDKGVTETEALMMLDNDIAYFIDRLQIQLPFFNGLDEVRRAVLINMCFNLGINGLLCFVKTLKLIDERKYNLAADEMLNSKWATQVGDRAIELSDMMKTGQWPKRLA